MSKYEGLELSEDAILIMRPFAGGWYPIQAVEGLSLSEQAKDHGEINEHLARVEDINGGVLWERVVQ